VGIAKAIIHSSDHPSVSAATEAIDRYFHDRNQSNSWKIPSKLQS
jgi:hypothetical protein